MAFEIEVKAHVDNVDALREKLRAAASGVHSFSKHDIYYGSPGAIPGTPESTLFRVRRGGRATLVTHKQRTMIADVEENRELEFAVADADAFEQFAKALGYAVSIEKQKRGERFEIGGADSGTVIELSHVAELGWFVEVEALVPDDAATAERTAAHATVVSLLKRFDIQESSIETRRYTEMLAAKRGDRSR